LVRRKNRFVAEVRLDSDAVVSAHCPNSGSMAECSEPGRRVWISAADNPGRKLAYTWELIEMPGSLVGVNTQVPNRLVAESIAAGYIPELAGYQNLRREVRVGDRSRIDILLTDPVRRRCFVEVKNCTLVTKGEARFPDAVTLRGQKHLRELAALCATKHRAVIFFFIQRMDARTFRPADEIDPVYGETLRRVIASGVEVLVYDTHITTRQISLRRAVPLRL
jgi:sugar fermentation stimulation protein A